MISCEAKRNLGYMEGIMRGSSGHRGKVLELLGLVIKEDKIGIKPMFLRTWLTTQEKKGVGSISTWEQRSDNHPFE